MSSQDYILYDYCGEELKISTLTEFFQIDGTKKQILSFVGGGGKTTTIIRLAKELAENRNGPKLKTVITTTTKMLLPDTACFLSDQNQEELTSALVRESYVFLGKEEFPKMKGTSGELFQKAVSLSDIILIEADGAKGMPMKAPAAHEPVVIPMTNKLIGVMGIDCIGRPIQEVCHRPEAVCRILGTSPEHRLSPFDGARLMMDSGGQKKGSKMMKEYTEKNYYIVINKVFNPDLINLGRQTARELRQLGCCHIALTDGRGEAG